MNTMLITLAHGLLAETGEEASLTTVILLSAAAGLFPFVVGFWASEKTRLREWAEGFAAGILIYLMIDFFGLTGSLGMGLTNLLVRGGLLIGFTIGLVLPAWHRLTPSWAWAVGVAMHSLGEGIIMGYNLHMGLGVALRFFPLLSFVLHKVAEGWVAGMLPGRGGAWKMSIFVAIPAVLGAVGGSFGVPGLVSSLSYSVGVGVLIGTLPRLMTDFKWSRAKAAAVGMVIMYVVGGLHEL